MTSPVLELSHVVKDFRGLRPLRIERLMVQAGESVAIQGLDQTSAEVLVNLIAGAILPDKGEVHLFGRSTAGIEDSADWLATVDRIGIISERAVLLDSLSTIQNLCIPFSLEIEPPTEDTRSRAAAIAREVGIDDDNWNRRVGDLDGAARVRVLTGRALAMNPDLLLAEHASARVERGDISRLGRDIRQIANARGAALVTLTADPEFAAASADRVMTLEAAAGRLVDQRPSGWLSRILRP